MKQSESKRQLQQSTSKELETVLAEERKNLYLLRQQAAMQQLTNKIAIRESRKKIARILTVARQIELSEAGEQAKA